TITVSSTANLTSSGATTITSRSVLLPIMIASSDSGGLFAGGSSGENVRADYDTLTTVSGTIFASGNATVDARTYVDAFGQGTADVGGLGVSGKTKTQLQVGFGSELTPSGAGVATTHVDLLNGADVTGRNVFLDAIVEKLKVVGTSKTHATAF